jgi:hypothetical protein
MVFLILQASNKCGNESIQMLIPPWISKWLPFKELDLYSDMLKELERVGYKKGLTYQAMPYNFIKSYRNNELKKIFFPNVERLYNLVGKKVTIFAHSFGNLNTLHQLSRKSQEYKDKYIKLWVSAAPPFLGAMSALKSVLGGNKDLLFFGFFGLHFNGSSQSVGTFPSMFELSQRNMYKMYENEPWFKWIQARLKYEKNNGSFEKSGMLFWPKIEEKCTPKSFKNIPTSCASGLSDLRLKPSVTLESGNKEYFLEDPQHVIGECSLHDFSKDYFNMFHNPDFFKFKNPGVPTVLIFSKSNDTIERTHYKGDIRNYTQKKKKFPPSVDKPGFGDGTVGTNSKLFPAIKWAYEFEHKESYGSEGENFKVSFLFYLF